MEFLLLISLISSSILTLGVYLTGYIDERQYEKFGYTGARVLVLAYTFIYGFINIIILLNVYVNYVAHDTQGFITLLFFIFSILLAIAIVHTDTENSMLEYFYNKSLLNKFLKNKYNDE